MREEAMTLLRAEVARTNITLTAERLDVSRTAVSLLVSDKYSADPTRMYQRIIDVLGSFPCPHLGADIARAKCRDLHTRQQPPAQRSSDVAHWRACQTCQHNRATPEGR